MESRAALSPTVRGRIRVEVAVLVCLPAPLPASIAGDVDSAPQAIATSRADQTGRAAAGPSGTAIFGLEPYYGTDPILVLGILNNEVKP